MSRFGESKKSLQFALELYLSLNPMMLTDSEKADLRNEWASYEEDKYVSHHLGDFIDYLYGKDLFKDFAEYVDTRRKLKGMRVLDVAAGIHIRSSIALKEKGAKVTAMDSESQPRAGIKVRKKSFRETTLLKDYDLVVAVRAPEECVRNIVEAAIAQGKDYIIIPSGDAFVDDSSRAKFVSDYDGATIKPWEVENSWAFKVVTNL